MRSVTQHVAKALMANPPSPGSWNLRLDKLCFRAEDENTDKKSAKHLSLRGVLVAYERARPHLGPCPSSPYEGLA